ncbi:MAG: HRDC domain-containing protein [Actinomycetia bacterium]|nr:HRDC domain-containing protein [Actinomycetes bacterium]
MTRSENPTPAEPQGDHLPILDRPGGGLPVIVDTPEAFDRAVSTLAGGSGPLAVDTERAQSFRYSSRAYLIQLRRAGAGTLLIDPIALQTGPEPADLSELVRALGDTEWIIHAATQDLPCLAEVGLVPGLLFDTELAGRLLGYPRVALAALVEQFFGLRLLKAFSAADWSMRPLPDDQIAYAALDVELLIELREALAAELKAAERDEWARQEFACLAAHALTPPPPPSSDRWRRTHGLHGVRTRRGLAVVRELWRTRDEIAAARDLAPGKVLPDAAIVQAGQAAENEPARPVRLGAIEGFHRRHARTYKDQWQAAIAAAAASPPSSWPALRAPHDGTPPPRTWRTAHPRAWARWEQWRAVVRELAESLGVPAENLLSPQMLRDLAWAPPANPDGVAAFLAAAGARPWQCDLVAPALTTAMAQTAR